MAHRKRKKLSVVTITVGLALLGAFVTWAETQGPISGLNLEGFETQKDEGLDWSKNPFVQTVEDVTVHELVVTAIVYHPDNAAALINGQVVRKGDHIGISEVVDILEKQVVLRNDAGLFRLALTQIKESAP